jgi:hypothetical protein
MMRFQFEGEVDYFELDPVAYAPALGGPGMMAYRARLEEVRSRLAPQPPESEPWSVPDRHERFVLEWNDKRLAVLDHDIEAIIRTHAKDRKVAAWFEDTAEAFEEISEIDLAIDWARQGMDFDSGHQSLKAGDYWCGLLRQHRPGEFIDARLLVFRRWPSSSSAARLYEAAGAAWTTHRGEVLTTLESNPADAVLFIVLTLKDAPLAWELAQSLPLDDDRAWNELIKAYQKIDPIAVLPIHARFVEGDLVKADARRYRGAARRLATMRTLAAGSDKAGEVDDLIARLRATHNHRPRLQQEFNRAGLPASPFRSDVE